MIAVYARQSIDKKDSDSIETQIARCVRLIDDPVENETYRVYKDKGYSGSNIDRPDFQRMIQDVEAGAIQKVIVYKVDRFSRSLVDFYHVYQVLEKHGVDFVSLNDNFDTSTATGRAMLSITLVFAQLERETIALRVKDNYYARAKQGRTLGGKVHYGYKKTPAVEDGRAMNLSVPDEMENPRLVQVYRWYDDDLSLAGICDRLREQNVPAPMGGNWDSSKVSKILRNPFYVRADADIYAYFRSKGCHITNDIGAFAGRHGLLLYGKRDRSASKYRDLRDQYLSVGLHEGVIPAELWLRVQEKLDANEPLKNSGKGSYTWLSGLTKCGYCGYAMTFVAYRPGRNYLNCRGKTNYHLCRGHAEAVFVEDVEDLVEERLLEKIVSLAPMAAQAPPPYDELANKLKIQLAELDREYDDYMEQLRHADDFLREHITKRLLLLQEKASGLKEELQKRQWKTGVPEGDGIDAEALLAVWSQGDVQQRKRISKRWIERIEIKDDNEIAVHWKVPQ